MEEKDWKFQFEHLLATHKKTVESLRKCRAKLKEVRKVVGGN